MKKLSNILFIIILLIGFLSCNSNRNNAETHNEIDVKKVEALLIQNNFKYEDFLNIWKGNANGEFNLVKKIDDFKFTAIYKPYSILTLEETETQNIEKIVTNDFKEKLIAYNNVHFVNFNIQHETFKNELIKLDIEDNQAYYDRITYYSFSVKNDVYMIEDKDTLKCDFVNFERTYEANPSIMLSFSFTRKSKLSNYSTLKFVFEDKIFNKGKLIFNFHTKPILLLNYLKPLS